MNIELCRKFFEQWRGCTLFAGFSGGADSTAALLTALYFKEEYAIDLRAVHFDHHLRGSASDEDALFCRRFAEAHDIPFSVIDLDIPSGNGLEETARLARLDHWKRLAGSKNKCAVILGHHRDDRIENFFLRMVRGSNLSSLLSPREVYSVGGVTFLRPLLNFSRGEIEAFLVENGVDNWRKDATNEQPDCSRNIIRLELLPKLYALFPGAVSGIRHCLENLEQDADFIEETAQKAFVPAHVSQRSYWRSLHPAVRARVIRLWLKKIPSRQFLLALTEELQKNPSSEPRTLPFSGSVQLVFQGEKVFLMQEKSPTPLLWELSQKNIAFGDWCFEAEESDSSVAVSKFEAVFDAEVLGDTLLLSLPQSGEEMTVFGSGKCLKLKKLRVDEKIPACYGLPVLKNSRGTIIWYPGVRHADFAPVTEKTRRVLRLKAFSAKFRVGFGID